MTDAKNESPDSKPAAQPVDEHDPLKDRKKLELTEKFHFGCHKGLSCFTDCCADINILLTPVDVLRLARRLDMSTSDFLDEHTMMPITKDLHLPVVQLKMGSEGKKACTFVSEDGCGVYEDRPWSCRMYPIGSALPPARSGEETKPVFFLVEDNFCKGHGESTEWTVESWMDDQGLKHQEDLEVGFQEIVGHPWFIGGTRQLDPKKMEMFYSACYDLDNFRRFIYETTFTKRFVLDKDLVEQMKTDDEALLRFAYLWLRFALFAEPTMEPTDEATQSATGATLGRES